MGKVKKLRQKFTNATKQDDQKVVGTELGSKLTINKNVFAGSKFDFSKLSDFSYDRLVNENHDEDDDATAAPKLVKMPSIIKTITKKDKMKNRRNNLLKKIDNVQKAKKEDKAKKRREKTAIIGDLRPLQDALPSLASLMKFKPSPHQIRTGLGFNTPTVAINHRQQVIPFKLESSVLPPKLSKISKKAIKKQKIKTLAKEYKQRFNHFQLVLSNEEFKRNPREAIAAHIQATNAEDCDRRKTEDYSPAGNRFDYETLKQNNKLEQLRNRQVKTSLKFMCGKLDDKFKQRRK